MATTRSHTDSDVAEQIRLLSEAHGLSEAVLPPAVRNARLAVLASRLEASLGKGATVELMVGRGNLSRDTACLALFCDADAYNRLRMPVLARLSFVARTFSDDRDATVQVKKNRWGAETYCPRDQIVWTAGFEFDFSPLPLGS